MNMRPQPGRGRKVDGAVLVFVAFSMVVLLGIAALAIDVGYMYVVRNELQNAADAGALAGAQVLYNAAGTSINTSANQTGLDYVLRHYADADKGVVEIATGCDNPTDPPQLGGQCVERGHWSFQTGLFTPNSSITPTALWDATTEELDLNTNFINAVRVITTRRPADDDPSRAANEPWFARTFGGSGPVIKAEAVAYIGYAGSLLPAELDQPIAICRQSILSNGEYNCNVGRMLTNNSDTAAWTNFSQPCQTASASSMAPLVCATGNPTMVTFGEGIGTTNGVQNSTLTAVDNCWRNQAGIDTDGLLGAPDGSPDQLWKLTLPVIDCPSSIGPCTPVMGAVEVNVVWISDQQDPHMNDIPKVMNHPTRGRWSCDPAASGAQACWDSFVDFFDLLADATTTTPAPYIQKTLYFLPDCSFHEPQGTSGGSNFGILAQIPVLVK